MLIFQGVWTIKSASQAHVYLMDHLKGGPDIRYCNWGRNNSSETHLFLATYCGYKSICDAVDGSEIRRENQLRLILVVEIPLFTTGFSTIPGGCLGFLPSTIPGGKSYTVILRILGFFSEEIVHRSPQYQKVVPPKKTNMEHENDAF